MRRVSVLTIYLMIVMALACAPEKNAKKPHGSIVGKDDSSGALKSDKESDQSEGIPGYLADPETIASNRLKEQAGHILTINAPAGSVKPGKLPLSELVVNFLETEANSPSTSKLTGRSLGQTQIAADGSFSARLTVNPEKPVIFSVEPRNRSDFSSVNLVQSDHPHAAFVKIGLNGTQVGGLSPDDVLNGILKELAASGAQVVCAEAIVITDPSQIDEALKNSKCLEQAKTMTSP